MTRFTVIGAGGFIGGRLAARLRAEGREVFAPARGDAALFSEDLGQVFYCAGLTGDFDVRPFDTVRAHVGLIAEVLEASRFDRLVYLSSTRLYDSLGAVGGREGDRLSIDVAAARNVYDLSKALGENLCLARSGGRAAVARLSNVLDWSDEVSGFVPDLMRRARRERVIDLPASAPEAARDYVMVEDVLDGLVAMADQRADGVINIAGGRNLSNAELAGLFEEAGWTLALGPSRQIAPPPQIATERLAALGVRPRDVRTAIGETLAGPGYFLG